jgi:hypothetical protein
LATLALTNKAAYTVQAYSCYALALHALDDARHQSIYRAQGVAHRLLLSTRSMNGHKALAALTLIANLSFHGLTSKTTKGVDGDNTVAGSFLAAGALHKLNPLRYHVDSRMRARCRVAVHNLLQHFLNTQLQQNIELPGTTIIAHKGRVKQKKSHGSNERSAKRKQSVGHIAQDLLRKSSNVLEHSMAGVKWLNRHFSEALFDDEANAYSSFSAEPSQNDPSGHCGGKTIPPLARVRWHTWPSRLDSLEHMRSLGCTRRMLVCTERGVPVNIVPISGHVFSSAEQLKNALVKSPKHGSLEAVVVRLVWKHNQYDNHGPNEKKRRSGRGTGSVVGPYKDTTLKLASGSAEGISNPQKSEAPQIQRPLKAVRGHVVNNKSHKSLQSQQNVTVFDAKGNILTPNQVASTRKQSVVAHSQRVKELAVQHKRTKTRAKMSTHDHKALADRGNRPAKATDQKGELLVRYRYKPEPGYVGQDSFSFRQPDQYSLLGPDGENEHRLSRMTRRRGKEVVVLVTVTHSEPAGDDETEGKDFTADEKRQQKSHNFAFEPIPQRIDRASNMPKDWEKEMAAGLASCQYMLRVVILQAKGVVTYPGEFYSF